MKVPFTTEEFFAVFAAYNGAVWPMQVLFYLLGMTALILAVKETRYSNKVISAVLAGLWLWIGLVYHWRYFTSINGAAYAFGALFILQALLFVWTGILHQKLWFRFHSNEYAIVGSLFILYALLIYPLVCILSEHGYPALPTFGLPCPTTIFTFGLLLWTDRRIPKYLLIIPVIWSVIGFSAVFQFGVWADAVLLLTGLITPVLIGYRDMREKELASFLSA